MEVTVVPYKRLIGLALVTTPLFALFGSTPAFFVKPVIEPGMIEYQIGPTPPVLARPLVESGMVHTEFDSTLAIFTILTILAALLWTANIVLIKFTSRLSIRRRTIIRYILSIFLAFLSTIALHELSRYIFHSSPNGILLPDGTRIPEPRESILFPLVQSESINLIIIILSELVILRTAKKHIEEENTQLKFANLEAKHTLLLQQLQPHFLFNALNTLKALIIKNPNKAEAYLNKLTAFLRHSVYTNKSIMVPLSDELDLTTNYLEMQKVRFGEALNYTIDIPESIQEQGFVPIYSLQLLAENAIKHNILTLASPLTIRIEANIAETSISVSNNLQLKPQLEQKSGGLGLNNLSERYRLQGKPDIVIKKSPQEFSVHINVCKQ